MGTIVDVHGDPVPGTELRVFDVAERTELDTARTDRNGEFRFEQLDETRDEETLLLAKKEVTASVAGNSVARHWFTTRTYGGGSQPMFELDDDLGRLPLDREALFPPESPVDETGQPLGIVSMWRFIGNPYQRRKSGFSDPTDQIYYIEVTNVNRTDVLGNPRREAHEIGRNWAHDLANGMFSLTLPQDGVVVDYGPQSSVDLNSTVGIRGAPTNIDTETPVAWHPTRTELPVFEACQYLESNPYERLSTTAAESAERIEEGFGRMLGALPVIGSVIGAFDTIEWVIGDSLDLYGEITSPTSGIRNPNTHDDVLLGWQSDNPGIDQDEASVVFSVPLRFTTEGNARFVGQAEYRHEDDRRPGPNDASGFVRWGFSRGPSGHIGGTDD